LLKGRNLGSNTHDISLLNDNNLPVSIKCPEHLNLCLCSLCWPTKSSYYV